MSPFGSGHQHAQNFADTQDAHDALQLVAKDVKTDLGRYACEGLGQEVRRAF